MVNFDCVYNIINDEEKRNVVTALIKEIEIYRNDESEYPLKRIGLNFPVFKDGGEVTELLWDKGNTVETRDVLQGMVRLARSMTLDALCNSDAEDKTPLVDESVDDEYEDTITIPVPLEAFGDAGLLGKDLHIQVIDGAVVITEDTDDE